MHSPRFFPDPVPYTSSRSKCTTGQPQRACSRSATSRRKGPQKAITILARRLLVVIWQALIHHALDRNADPAALERAWLTWATDHRLATSLGLSRAEFVRRALAQIGVPSPER